jgi:lipoprotein-releasing system ATP-binding protein
MENSRAAPDRVGEAIRLEGVGKFYRGPAGTDLRVLSDIELSVDRGESLAVLGPSGAGKSTLLSIMGTLEPPSQGRVLLFGKDPRGMGSRELSRLRGSGIGFVFQRHFLLPYLSLLENVLLPSLALGRLGAAGKQEASERALALIDRVGLGGREGHRPDELSGGERQRAALARAMMNRPAILLADEPTGALDSANAESLAELLTRLNREEGTALVLVTHAESLARRMSRRLDILDGRIR